MMHLYIVHFRGACTSIITHVLLLFCSSHYNYTKIAHYRTNCLRSLRWQGSWLFVAIILSSTWHIVVA